jgi:hypothetical protein
MLYNYIKASQIIKATPSGYTIKELKTHSAEKYWTTYETKEFTNTGDTFDFKVSESGNSPIIDNRFGTFIFNRSVEALNGTTPVTNALNIESIWDKRFPETIKLKYPGKINTQKRNLSNEENYTFKIWENRSSSALDVAKIISNDLPTSIRTSDYFYDLLAFMKADAGSSYDDWLKRPSLSLKLLLSKGIQKDEKLYQLYKINDVNIQSLSKDFDEYIPWCFDQDGVKIEQYKIAMITSFNKKEIYLLLELRSSDITQEIDEDDDTISKIRTIENVIFWRSGILDTNISKTIRNRDKTLLSKDNNISRISDYFRESEIETDTLISFQKNRLENKIDLVVPIDNDTGTYQVVSNTDDYFLTLEAPSILKRFVFGNVSTVNLNINISTASKIFTDHFKDKVHIFVDGNLLTYDEFYILNGNIISTLSNTDSYVEIYIDQYDSISYSFTLAVEKSTLTEGELSYILYNNKFLWNTTQDKKYLLFKKEETNGCRLVNGSNGDYVIIHSLFFNLDDDGIITVPTGSISTTDNITDVSDARENNINYDPFLYKTSASSGENHINNKDLWILDNTKKLVKVDDNEPYLEKIEDIVDTIEIMGEEDKNIELKKNESISGMTTALTKVLGKGNILTNIISSDEKAYLNTHYTQMSNLNTNILDMLLYANASVWENLDANSPMKINKDYMIVRYTGSGDFPLLKVIKTGIYKYNVDLNEVTIKVKDTKRNNVGYYILHRTSEQFSELYEYSFDTNVSYIII